jgi:hypothetical protein
MTNFEKIESIKEEISDIFTEIQDYFILMGSKLIIRKHHYNDTSPHLNLEGLKKSDPEKFKLLRFQYFQIKSLSSLPIDDFEKFSNKKHSDIINDIRMFEKIKEN